jgi:8-oxo-dGTP diphosphatase
MENENKIIVCAKGVIIHNGKVLIIKRSDNAHVGSGTWECVGGKIEFGETLEETLVREVKEEVGLEISIGNILYATTLKTTPTRQVVILTYLCESKDENVVLSEEHSDYLWATKKQLRELLPQGIIDDFEKNDVFELEGIQ